MNDNEIAKEVYDKVVSKFSLELKRCERSLNLEGTSAGAIIKQDKMQHALMELHDLKDRSENLSHIGFMNILRTIMHKYMPYLNDNFKHYKQLDLNI